MIRTDIAIDRGATYSNTLVFDATQAAYDFEALLTDHSYSPPRDRDDSDIISYTVSQSGASVTVSLTATQTLDLNPNRLYFWKLYRSLGETYETTHGGNAFIRR